MVSVCNSKFCGLLGVQLTHAKSVATQGILFNH
jgi:hypothetical protein